MTDTPDTKALRDVIAAWNRRVPLDRSDELDRVKADLRLTTTDLEDMAEYANALIGRRLAAESAFAVALREMGRRARRERVEERVAPGAAGAAGDIEQSSQHQRRPGALHDGENGRLCEGGLVMRVSVACEYSGVVRRAS